MRGPWSALAQRLGRLGRLRHEEKLRLSEQACEEQEKEIDFLRETVKNNNDNTRRARIEAVQEYRDSEALLKELGSSFADGFDDCLRQVKSSFLDLGLDHIDINAGGQTPTHAVESEGTAEIFGDVPDADDEPVPAHDEACDPSSAKPVVPVEAPNAEE